MQPIDPADKRQPNVQIAASLRAAILTGELKPSSQLPSGHELAKFFGVARMTVQTAIRTLRDEGFVVSRAGSGVYVRDQADLPAPDEGDHPLTGAATFLFEMGQLKNLPRAGWLLLGIPSPESVAEHSFRVGIIGMMLAAAEGADIGHTAALGIFHDAHETRIGDVPSVGRAYISTAKPEAVTAHQTASLPSETAKMLQALTAEYEANKTVEAQLAHDADKIETLLQAIEYQAQGHDTKAWRDTSIAALRTSAGQQMARAISATDPHGWWSAFAASYHELRASTRGRSRRQRDGSEGS
jgi:5'-deoxynucleotidase YfbR-like HD superfamily hydrolase/DNA-binding transcriptional regulator YhcF (GntR family)